MTTSLFEAYSFIIQDLMFSPLFLLALQATVALGNIEKAIFLGPSSLRVPIAHPSLEDLRLDALSPQHWSLRTHIQAQFPTDASKYGPASWVLLHGLQEGQRYEVRICWAATQPTSFRLDTYELSTVFDTPGLITSLARYSEARQPDPIQIEDQRPSLSKGYKKHSGNEEEVSSMLFLQIFAAADYYTMDKTIMENVPPVYVDIILDPYLFNIFPRSLVPTAAYIIILAIGSWYLSKYIRAWIQRLPKDDADSEKKKL